MAVPRDGTTSLNGLRFHFLDWGTAARPPLLLLHGGAQTAHSWDEVAPDLARDHHVLALDQRGHGDTDWAPDGRYRREDFVADVRAFLDDRGWATATLIALSLGGLNSIAFAAAHPERITGLVVVDVAPTISSAGGKAIAAQLGVREFASFEEAVARAQAFNPLRTAENIRERLRHALRETPEGRWTYKFDTRIGSGGLETDFEQLWEKVRAIRCPALLVRGAQSAILTREAAARFVEELPGATVVEVPNAGHSVMGDNPAGFLAAVRPFLARHAL
ncbi:MAG TPA: alpha/beta hydrolase [Candidatus Binatia bacterium]|nr:alpha/beta hydrolase [Candidatus Binatia bacterium]